ncbi:MAG: hypothetical protein AAF676_18300, partial [Pseudomonadota bacterium]
GHVVFRNEVLELVHCTATTERVRPRPLFVAPPQINKDYSIDMSPGKSMIEFLLAQGLQPYCVSWRNPTPAQRDWDLHTHVEALEEACDAAREITGSDSVNIMGSCSGGITLAAYAGWLAARDRSARSTPRSWRSAFWTPRRRRTAISAPWSRPPPSRRRRRRRRRAARWTARTWPRCSLGCGRTI